MITREEYEKLEQQHKEGCRKNDYSKMIMMGSKEAAQMNKFEQENICKHASVRSEQGGQIDICNYCGKTWG